MNTLDPSLMNQTDDRHVHTLRVSANVELPNSVGMSYESYHSIEMYLFFIE